MAGAFLSEAVGLDYGISKLSPVPLPPSIIIALVGRNEFVNWLKTDVVSLPN